MCVEVIYRMLLLRSNCVYECHVSHSASEGENLSRSRCLLHRSKGTQCLHLRLGDETCLELQMLLWAITLIKLHFFLLCSLIFVPEKNLPDSKQLLLRVIPFMSLPAPGSLQPISFLCYLFHATKAL